MKLVLWRAKNLNLRLHITEEIKYIIQMSIHDISFPMYIFDINWGSANFNDWKWSIYLALGSNVSIGQRLAKVLSADSFESVLYTWPCAREFKGLSLLGPALRMSRSPVFNLARYRRF